MCYRSDVTDPFPPTPPRVRRPDNPITLRINEGGRTWLKNKSEEFDVTQTEVIKAALALAAKKSIEFDKILKERKE